MQTMNNPPENSNYLKEISVLPREIHLYPWVNSKNRRDNSLSPKENSKKPEDNLLCPTDNSLNPWVNSKKQKNNSLSPAEILKKQRDILPRYLSGDFVTSSVVEKQNTNGLTNKFKSSNQ